MISLQVIKLIKKNKGRYQVVLDNGESILLDEEIIIKYGLFLNKVINSSILSKIKTDNQYLEIYNQALKYISIRLRSKKEMDQYLINKKYPQELIAKLIKQLSKQGYLDDYRFAEALINDRFQFSKDGPFKIKRRLEEHNLESLIIEELINKIDQQQIILKMEKLLARQIKLKSKESGYKLKNKLFAYLYNLGYDKELILESLTKIKNREEG